MFVIIYIPRWRRAAARFHDGGGGDRQEKKKKSSFDVPEEAVTDEGTVLGRKESLYNRLKSYTGRQSDRPPG